MIKCDHCGDSIDGERFMELQPGGFMHDGPEMYRDNMAWTVHVECLEEFVAEYDDGGA